MELPEKKSVRFSSPFDEPTPNHTRTGGISKAKPQQQPSNKNKMSVSQFKNPVLKENNFPEKMTEKTASNEAIHNSSVASSVSGDSWDAFDAKMMKSSATPKVQSQMTKFLELSATQNKSLNIEDDEFASMSFQDAKSLIEKDENERLMFMNSNSFDELDQLEAPSLLSVTSYFQQNSSFPVPYVGNESTMMFGSAANLGLPSSMQDSMTSLPPSVSRRTSDNLISSNRTSDHFPPSEMDFDEDDPDIALNRKDSLFRFFNGTESNRFDKNDIVDYVMDYCKRRASFRSSDVSLNLPNTPPLPKQPLNSLNWPDESHRETEVVRKRDDSGINFSSEKTLMNSERNSSCMIGESIADISKPESRTSSVFKLPGQSNSTNKKRLESDPLQQNKQNQEMPEEGSIIISDGGSLREKDAAFLDISESDVGGVDGFEKFKKNLKQRHETKEDRYRRMKFKGHDEFEKKRLQIDEKHSHPRLSPKSLSGPGASATLERPKNPMPSNSPPEKLVSSKNERTASTSTLSTPLQTQTDIITHRKAAEGQCHSTPITTESFLQKFLNPAMAADAVKSMMQHQMGKSLDISKNTSSVDRSEKYKKQRKIESLSSGSDSSEIANERRRSSNQHLERVQKFTREKGMQAIAEKPLKPVINTDVGVSNNNPTPSNNVVASLNKPPPPPQSLPLQVPVSTMVATAMQQYHQSNPIITTPQPIVSQYAGATTTCSCPHQCAGFMHPTAVPHGLPAMSHGNPIVIHIHLPNSMPGAGVHTVAGTPTMDVPK